MSEPSYETLYGQAPPTRIRVRHKVKCWPQFFEPLLRGLKQFELRRDDRPEGYQVGDELLEQEWDPEIEGYTGRECLVRVGYVMPAVTVRKLIHPLLENDEMESFVIMSVSRV